MRRIDASVFADDAAKFDYLVSRHQQARLDQIEEKTPGLAQCYERLVVSLERIETIRKSDEKGIRWLETTHRGFSLNLTPFDVSESLGRFVNSLDCGWIFTSATLAVGDDFSHLKGRLGLEEASDLKLESPFDYQNNSLIGQDLTPRLP